MKPDLIQILILKAIPKLNQKLKNYERGSPITDRFWGIILRIVGWLLILPFLTKFICNQTLRLDFWENYLYQNFPSIYDFFIFDSLMTMIGFGIFVLIGIKLERIGRGLRPTIDNISSITEENYKPFILYLRTFERDRSYGLINDWEYQLSFALGKSHRFIAVGDPADIIPKVGAERIYMDEKNWKDKVRFLIQHASCVIIGIGATPSLSWELEQVKKFVNPQKIFFFSPPMKDSDQAIVLYNSFTKIAKEVFETDFPLYDGKDPAILFVALNNSWVPYKLVPDFGNKGNNVRKTSNLVNLYVALDPIFDQLGALPPYHVRMGITNYYIYKYFWKTLIILLIAILILVALVFLYQ